jgi:hypothetical protein
MTKEEFEKRYCERSKITIEEYYNDYNLITVPCNCGITGCYGWAAVTNSPSALKAHKDFYM